MVSKSQVQRVCPVCQHPHAEPVFANVMAPVGGIDMSTTLGRCKRCGFHFACLLPAGDSFNTYYAELSKYDVAACISPIDQVRIDEAVKLCERHVPKDDCVIDLGCGFGAFLASLGSRGWTDLHGVDPAPNSASRAMALFGLGRVHRASLAQAHTVLPLHQADLVCIMAVLEHLPDLHHDLRDLLPRLRPGCKILVEVPALEYFSPHDSEPFGEFSLEHIQFFSARSLQNLFEGMGARTIALQLQPLPLVRSGSVFGIFEWTGHNLPIDDLVPEPSTAFSQYVDSSKAALEIALKCIPNGPLIVYGAGSHTARILPRIEKMADTQILAIVDGNPNLWGKTLGRWSVQEPSLINKIQMSPVLISSFRSQSQIAAKLQETCPNPQVLMYRE